MAANEWLHLPVPVELKFRVLQKWISLFELVGPLNSSKKTQREPQRVILKENSFNLKKSRGM